MELNITVLCTSGIIFQIYFYKYFAALLLRKSPEISKHPDYLNVNGSNGDQSAALQKSRNFKAHRLFECM